MGEISYVNTEIQPDQIELNSKLPDEYKNLEKIEDLKKLRKHSAKAEVIVQEIRKILRNDPADKILIFSAVSSEKSLTLIKIFI